MNPLHLQFGTGALAVSWAALLLVLAWAIWRVKWERIADWGFGRVWHGAITFVVLLWSLKASLRDGFTFHLLGIVATFLALGLPLAITSAVLSLFVLAIIQQAAFVNIAPTFFILVAPALTVGRLVLWFVEARLPPHMFVYLFGAAFAGAGLSIAVVVPISLLTWSQFSDRSFLRVMGDYLPIAIQLGFAEAVLTGMLITIGVVYKPQWISTFDDARYLFARKD